MYITIRFIVVMFYIFKAPNKAFDFSKESTATSTISWTNVLRCIKDVQYIFCYIYIIYVYVYIYLHTSGVYLWWWLRVLNSPPTNFRELYKNVVFFLCIDIAIFFTIIT